MEEKAYSIHIYGHQMCNYIKPRLILNYMLLIKLDLVE